MPLWLRRKGIQLATPFSEKSLLRWDPPYIIMPKLDGDRCRAVHDSRAMVTLLSSEENELWASPLVQQELESVGIRDVELDGEHYIHGRSQAELHGIVSSQRVELHQDYEQVELHLFDYVDETIPQWKRLLLLNKLYHERLSHLPHIKLVPYYIINTVEQVYHMLEYFLSQGYEGFILRKKDEVYKRGRSVRMMKFKPKKKDVFLIVGLNEAISQDGKPKSTLGSFQCASPPKEGTFPVGAGKLDHKEREEYWEIGKDLVGFHLLVEYQHLTEKNGVPRSGVAVRPLFTKEEVEDARKLN